MILADLRLEALRIPFKASFKHASAERAVTSTVLARCESASGHLGYGEGCPRPYVTGESVESCEAFFSRHRDALVASIHGLDDLLEWMNIHSTDIDANPAAWCALELAILDALAKYHETTIEGLLGLSALSGTFTYTAVLGDSDLATFAALAKRYAQSGFLDFKLKTGKDAGIDREKIAVLHAAAPGARVRLDANNLWSVPADFATYFHKLGHAVEAVEEPLQAHDFAGLVEGIRATGLRVILDESFLSTAHFEAAASLGDKAVINLRVSKMGGLIRSLGIAREAGARGIPLIVGAQVGETSILTRAALVVAHAHRDNLMAQEGAFGTFLLQEDIVADPLMFGGGGRLEADKWAGRGQPGFGLDYIASRMPF